MKSIFLIRHGESESNVDKTVLRTIPNAKVELTEKGRVQAFNAGILLRDIGAFSATIGDPLFIVSPHVRTQQTYTEILKSLPERAPTRYGPEYREDYLIREIDIGNFIKDFDSIRRDLHAIGKFNYRFPNGESGADLVLRASIFWERNKQKLTSSLGRDTIIVTHAATINALRMVIENLTVAEFEALPKPRNCGILRYDVDHFSNLTIGENLLH